MKDYHKYPRTGHFPWSLGASNDDKIIKDLSPFYGMVGIVSEKMDGENTNLYPDRYHARSIDSKDDPSRHWVKGLWGNIKHEIPEGWRICGENMFAKHSIYYDNLYSYFYVYSIWDDTNTCLSWVDTLYICKCLNLVSVPVIDTIIFDEEYLRNLPSKMDLNKQEGYVFRNAESFHYDDFANNVAKFVRAGHVTTDSHWMFQKIIPNKLINHYLIYEKIN